MIRELFPEVPHIRGRQIVLKGLTGEDAPALREFVDDLRIYRYLPTFLFEKNIRMCIPSSTVFILSVSRTL